MHPAAPGRPIFILSHARTGSTLMRYIIDAHPEVCSPPEVALGRLCQTLGYTLALTLLPGETPAKEQRQSVVSAAIREHVDGIMGAYCLAKGKPRWCDKSTNNLEHLGVIDRVFPDAQFICLHRQCLDVVHSLLELFRYGFPGSYGHMVVRSPDNLVDAMIDTWNEATTRLLDFEAGHPQSCIRVKYEDLVTDTPAEVQRMFSFLGIAFEPHMLDAVFSTPHDPGPADLKIQFTSSVLRGRIGKGLQVPRRQISDDRLVKVNAFHEVLGYPAVTREGGPELEKVLQASHNVSRLLEPLQWG
jgi:protein-tyrosine sulfotransferase